MTHFPWPEKATRTGADTIRLCSNEEDLATRHSTVDQLTGKPEPVAVPRQVAVIR